jgi:nucleotide-binding universal stress UspA family protein
MVLRPVILGPVDFSEPSRAALRYAASIAEHFAARLIVLTIDDPLLTESADLTLGPTWLPHDSQRELEHFVAHTFEHRPQGFLDLQIEVATGKPAQEILRLANERGCDLIVMSSHGLTGVRKLFFGSTTERVLRETNVPVLIVPAADPGPRHLEDVKPFVRRVLAPVDLTTATGRQVQVARELAETLDVPLLLAHVVEPARLRPAVLRRLPNIDIDRRARADQALADLVATVPPVLKPEALVAYGDPAEEIAKVARDRRAGLIVIGLHSSPLAGPRMGSVTYRVLCLAPSTLVLALPPATERASNRLAISAAERVAGTSGKRHGDNR